MESTMSPQTEDIRQVGGQPLLLKHDAGVNKRAPKHWLGLAITVIVVAALLISGIGSRVKARTTLNAETAQMALPAVSVVSPKQTSPADEIILPGIVARFI